MPNRAQRQCRDAAVAIVAIAAMCVPLCEARAQGQAERHYQATFRDGTQVVGRDLRDMGVKDAQPRLDDRPLFDAANPVRLIHNTALTVSQATGPYVVFANGDVLPGRVVGVLDADADAHLPARARIALSAPLASATEASGGEIHVLPEHIAHAVWTARSVGAAEAGGLVLTTGRHVPIKAMRWTETGVRALTDEGNLAVAWDELAEVHPPQQGRIATMAALVADAVASDGVAGGEATKDDSVVRLRTADGAIVTCLQSTLIADRQHLAPGVALYQRVTPAWSLEPIRMPAGVIAWWSYRALDEVPLSSLPATTLSSRSYTGFAWSWRRDTNVRGGALASGAIESDAGIGTHSYSEVAFDLPPGTKRFTTWVGLDRAVGGGGCVRCAVYRDEPTGKPLWQSGFLRGGQEPVRVNVGGLDKATRIILVTDFAHDNRPRGADPGDIRDEVDWLMPMVKYDPPTAQPNHP